MEKNVDIVRSILYNTSKIFEKILGREKYLYLNSQKRAGTEWKSCREYMEKRNSEKLSEYYIKCYSK